MRAPQPAAGSWRSWALAVAILVGLNALVLHTPLIWGKTTLWVQEPRERLRWTGFWQVYDVARTLHRPQPDAAERVALIGNSLMWFAAQDAYVERALRQLAPDADVQVDNLSFFGAKIGDIEIVSRELARLQPSVVVLALGGSELVVTKHLQLINPTGRLLDAGWRDGPLPPRSRSERVDRWLRTAWPMYRFRHFARAGLADRLRPAAADQSIPTHFGSPAEVLAFLEGARGTSAVATYEAWRAAPTLEGFAAFMRARGVPAEPIDPLPDPATLTLESPGVAVLDRLLARLAAGPWQTFIVLMPENPLLDADREGRYHRLGFSARAAEVIGRVAARHAVRVVDGRRWLPAEAFIDFQHPWPDVSGFQVPLAEEILRARQS